MLLLVVFVSTLLSVPFLVDLSKRSDRFNILSYSVAPGFIRKALVGMMVLGVIVPGSRMVYGQSRVKKQILTHIRQIDERVLLAEGGQLEVLREAIGNARVVMLGEQAHGDGTTFLAKSAIVKMLHDSMGFNVLAFESDFFALNRGWSAISKDAESISNLLKHNLYPLWSYSNECSDLLYNYIPATYKSNHPLHVAGIDPQLHGRYTADSLKSRLAGYFTRYDGSLSHLQKERSVCIALVDSINVLNVKTRSFLDSLMRSDYSGTVHRFASSIDSICRSLPVEARESEEFMALQSLRAFSLELLNYNDNQLSTKTRDEQMARNLEWLLTAKYPGEKIIVWAANAHIIKNATTAFKNKGIGMNSMGTYFTKDLKQEGSTYILGFTSGFGRSQTTLRKTPTKIVAVKKGFEAWVPDSYTYAFIDFRDLTRGWKHGDTYFRMKGRGHGPVSAQWTKVFDGVFYIQEMKGATVLK